MINQLSDLLDRLAARAPEVCERVNGGIPVKYIINDYGFWFTTEGELIACPKDDITKNIGGRPARAWLEDALRGEAQKKGLRWRTENDAGAYGIRFQAIVDGQKAVKDTLAEALLAAFVAALGVER